MFSPDCQSAQSSRSAAGYLPPRMSSPRFRWWRTALWVVALSGVAVLAVRALVGDVYYVDSRSMAPTLHGAARGGEYVFVRFDRASPLERFDLVVVQRPGDDRPLVKRVVALGGETVQLAGGDLLFDGRVLPPDAPRAPWIELFDSRGDAFEQHFSTARFPAPWTQSSAGQLVDVQGARAAEAEYKRGALDEFREPSGERGGGRRHVSDLALELELRTEGVWRALRLRLSEEGDRFDLVLEPAAQPGRVRARIERRVVARLSFEVLVERELDFDFSAPHRLCFANIDNRLRFDLDDERGALAFDYPENTPMSGQESGFQHQLPRAAFGGENLRAQITRVRLLRDLSWADLGRFAVNGPLVLAPEELFLLGDNSSESLDSREWGPARQSWRVGKPLAVVWPPSRWRWLDARAP